MKNINILLTASMAIMAVVASSCRLIEDDYDVVDLHFNVSTGCSGVDSLLSKTIVDLDGVNSDTSLEIICQERPATTESLTRAALIDNVSNESFATNGFGLYGFDAAGGKVIDGVNVTVNGSQGTPVTDYKWVKLTKMSFVGFYPKTETIFSSAAATGSWDFSYTVPAAATDQKDLMLSYFTGTSASGTASLNFTHPLTCVKFKLGDLESDLGNITAINLKGVYSSGTCTVTPSGNNLTYSWAGTGTTTVTSSGNETTVKDKILGNDFTFIVIPQNLASQSVTLQLVFSDAGSFSVELNTGEWKMGTIHTYTISAKPGCSIVVDDEVSGVEKSNVVIKNDGTSDAFVRASIVGNWTDSDGNIVAPWNSVSYAADFTGLCGTGWEYDTTDGFYYYNTKLAPNQELKTANGNQIFDKYKVSAFPAGATELHMTVLVQAVKYDSAKTYKTVWN